MQCRENKAVVGNNEVIISVLSLKHVTFDICVLSAFTFTTRIPHKAFQKLRTRLRMLGKAPHTTFLEPCLFSSP